jgi:hypothetical protein
MADKSWLADAQWGEAPASGAGAPDWMATAQWATGGNQPLPAGEYQVGSDFQEVPHLDANGNPAPVPTNRDVQALQGNQAALSYAANEAAPSQFGPSIAADYQGVPAQAFDAQFGQGAAQAYGGVSLNPPPAAGPAPLSRE